jgi:hypothetical protein
MSNVESYPNRSDLRNPAAKIARQVVPGQTYGEGTRQMEAQRAVPMGAAPAQVQAGAAAAQLAERANRVRVAPGQLGDLYGPSDMTRPITDGADFGPGRTAAQAGIPKYIEPVNPVMDELLAIYRQFPNEDLADLISAFRDGGV